MPNKNIFVIGFMLFAMFFGAGNLIFPPALGFQSGDSFWPALLGFVLTGIGLPLISVIVGSFSKKGYEESLNHIHPLYSRVFLISIYLTIGPLFAIPRTATTAYEMGIVPYLSQATNRSLFIFSIFFFLIVYFIAMNREDLSNAIGKYLTPILLAVVTLLILLTNFHYFDNAPQSTHPVFQTQLPFVIGFTEGYLTMDALAAIAFSIVVLNAFQKTGLTDKRALFQGTVKASVLAAFLLCFIYGGLALAGNRVPMETTIPENQYAGTFLLQFMSEQVLGSLGIGLLALTVFLSCLTTATGLIASVSEYFNHLFPMVSYNKFALIFSILSLLIANQGLEQVIAMSVPVLTIIYPVAMTSVFLILFSYVLPSPKISLQLPVFLVFSISLVSTAQDMEWISAGWVEQLPLYAYQMEWLPLLIGGYLIGLLLGKNQSKVMY